MSPKASVIRVLSVCTPSPVTTTGTGPAPATSPEVAPLSRSHWMRTTPEPLVSVPETFTLTVPVWTQPAGTEVVSTGALTSTCTMCVVQPESLPALSTILVLTVWVPCCVMCRTTPLAPELTVPSTSHWTYERPDSASAPATVMSTVLCCQPVGAVVLSAG